MEEVKWGRSIRDEENGLTAAEVLSIAKNVTRGGALRSIISIISAGAAIRTASALTIDHRTKVPMFAKVRENLFQISALSKRTQDRSILHPYNSSDQASNKSFLRSRYRRSDSIRWNSSSNRFCSILLVIHQRSGELRVNRITLTVCLAARTGGRAAPV